MTSPPELTQILLVEDSVADIRLTVEALKDAKVINELHVARDGVEALQFLYRESPHEGAPRPHLILLDLNLPRLDGKEVLARVKADPDLRSIPIAVLTTSSSEADVLQSYDLGANCYIVKPVDLAQFLNVVQSIDEFFLGMVRLPRTS